MAKAARASVLILLLACSAQAGWIQNGSATPPPSDPASAGQESTNAAEESETQATVEDGTQGTMTQIALDLLTLLPSLI